VPPPRRHVADLPIPPGIGRADRILFFGGSFDPPHRAHTRLPFEVARAWWPGKRTLVVYVPAARSPHKPDPPAADHHRLAMLRLALADRDGWFLWQQELADAALNPGEPSYWADTWAIAADAFPHADRAFLIGVDQALALHRWARFREFWADAVVMRRAEDLSASDFARRMHATGAWSPGEIERWSSRLVPTPTVDASSTGVRSALADPAQRNARIESLDPGVQQYILDHGLYAGPPA
jgi:nicotinate-nucleotide adenylyltransferase